MEFSISKEQPPISVSDYGVLCLIFCCISFVAVIFRIKLTASLYKIHHLINILFTLHFDLILGVSEEDIFYFKHSVEYIKYEIIYLR